MILTLEIKQTTKFYNRAPYIYASKNCCTNKQTNPSSFDAIWQITDYLDPIYKMAKIK